MACEDGETTQARAKGTVANSTRLKTGRLWANLPSRLGERSRKGIFFSGPNKNCAAQLIGICLLDGMLCEGGHPGFHEAPRFP